MTDTEILDWIDKQGDIGTLSIDTDLEAEFEPLFWNKFYFNGSIPRNLREAVERRNA